MEEAGPSNKKSHSRIYRVRRRKNTIVPVVDAKTLRCEARYLPFLCKTCQTFSEYLHDLQFFRHSAELGVHDPRQIMDMLAPCSSGVIAAL